MQKFRIKRSEIEIICSMIEEKNGKYYALVNLGYPDFIVEGELLEGGTVERKGCWGCAICDKSGCAPGICGCHNKKEERCPVCLAIYYYCKFSNIQIQQSNHFNRETPKVPKPLIPVEGSEFGKNSNAYKINQILAYLDSKENK